MASSPPRAFGGSNLGAFARFVGPSGFFLIALVVVAHVLYSPLGFNPTDDGLQLAFARRVAHGEVPHRDFLSVRPALSYYLWAPSLRLGDSVIVATRGLVWLEWGILVWLWTRVLVRRILRHALAPVEELALTTVGFMVGFHNFPVMPWHTIDGLFLLSLGLALTKARSRGWRATGWCLVGLAPLVKQSYAPAVLLLLLMGRERAKPWAWGSAIVPGLVYAMVMAASGALGDALAQLTSNPRFLATAVLTYPVTYPLFPLVVVGAAGWAFLWDKAGKRTKLWGAVALAAAGIVPPLALLNIFAPQMFSIHLFGVALGLAAGLALVRCFSQGGLPCAAVLRRVGTLLAEALILAWTSAISIAVNYPALAVGILWCALFAALFRPWRILFSSLRWRQLAAVALIVVTAGAFHYGRTNLIYRERPACELTARLDGVLAGGLGVRTNPRVREMLAELRDLATSATQASVRYAVLPDCAAWWIGALQPNPLPFIWDNEVELPGPLRARAVEALRQTRGRVRFFVTRYETDSLAEGLRPLRPRYPATQALRSMARKLGETRYFEIYELSD